MNDPLTPERRAELRELLDSIGYDNSEPLRDWMMGHLSGRTHAAMVDGAVNALPALLAAADERDRLRAVIERMQALAPVDVSDWDEDDPLMVCAADLHRALDG